MDADPFALLRGRLIASSPSSSSSSSCLAKGKSSGISRSGSPGGPERYALRRLPMLPELYAPSTTLSLDPESIPSKRRAAFTTTERGQAPLSLDPFVVRVMCVDTKTSSPTRTEPSRKRFPPRATRLFDDVELVDYRSRHGRFARPSIIGTRSKR